jgi:hypothetical protein
MSRPWVKDGAKPVERNQHDYRGHEKDEDEDSWKVA